MKDQSNARKNGLRTASDIKEFIFENTPVCHMAAFGVAGYKMSAREYIHMRGLNVRQVIEAYKFANPQPHDHN